MQRHYNHSSNNVDGMNGMAVEEKAGLVRQYGQDNDANGREAGPGGCG